ncbi:MAG: hypothetical protein H7A43_02635 [Verrucomicrobia bacterium]|nr:hypothetical protein [Verrucomicrobiota bacterium]
MPEESEIASAWSRQYGSYRVYPITYAAMLAARKIFDGDVLVDPSMLVDCGKRRELYEKSLRDTDTFLDTLEGDFLLCGMDPGFVYYALFHTYLFSRMIREARRRHGEGPVVVMPFFSRSTAPVLLIKVAQALDLAASEANWFHKPGRRDIIKQVVYHRFSRLYYAMRRIRAVRTAAAAACRAERVDVLIVGFEGADRRNQYDLYQRLSREEHVRTRWIRPAGERFRLTADEQARDRSVEESPEAGHVQDVDWDSRIARSGVCRTGIILRELLRARISAAARSAAALALSPHGASIFADLMTDTSSAARREAVYAVLDRYRPAVTVLSASHQLNRYARAWARDRRSDSLRLPHGVEYFKYMRCWWSFDAVGLPGRRAGKDFDLHHGAEGAMTGLVGGMGHARQYSLASERGTAASSAKTVLYPLSFISYVFPDMPAEIEQDLRALLDVISRHGCRFRLRNHPRAGMWMPDDYTRMKQELAHDAFDIGDSGCSLSEDLKNCCLVLARHWGGAIVQALYSRVPVIAWMPRPATTYSDEILESFPMMARTPSELAAALVRLEDPAAVEDVIRQQDVLLAELFEDPYDDSPDRAAAFILNALKRRKDGGL